MTTHICETCGDATLSEHECPGCRPAIARPDDAPPTTAVAPRGAGPASERQAPPRTDAAALGAATIAGSVAAHGTVVDTGPAPAAGRLLDALCDMRDLAAETADAEEESTFTRLAWRAKRDTLDLVIRMVSDAIPDIEREAVEGAPIGDAA